MKKTEPVGSFKCRFNQALRQKFNPFHSKTIFLLEEDRAIASVFTNVLEVVGLNSVSASSLEEARYIMKVYRGKFFLALLDYKSCKFQPERIRRKFHRLNRGAKVILLSGYGINRVKSENTILAYDGFIEKPVTPARLLTKIASVVEPALDRKNNKYFALSSYPESC